MTHIRKLTAISIVALFVAPAHSGGLAADGCHKRNGWDIVEYQVPGKPGIRRPPRIDSDG